MFLYHVRITIRYSVEVPNCLMCKVCTVYVEILN